MSKSLQSIPYSVLDLAPIREDGTPQDAFHRTVDLAKHTEKLGYTRYWLAEHHNMPFIASSATSVLIGHVASHTSTIRVGSGGIMLPNHAPLVIAEQFGTLESLYPERVDLGLGRAPGTDQLTAHALRRGVKSGPNDFPDQLEELRSYFDPTRGKDNPHVRAYPGEGLDIPIWLLGSSGYSAQLAGKEGLPFAFASHFSPRDTVPALDLYRREFKPSKHLDQPHAMVGVNIIAADTDEEAERLSTTLQQQFLNLIRQNEFPLPPPVDSMEDIWTERERQALQQQLSSSIIGSKDTVRKKLYDFIEKTGADEIMVISQIYDHEARRRSYEIVAELFQEHSS
ncbi:LLM class flavin-dependent oxidoreductase [Pontibacillus salicampi]|uniref:LLM class flavin-dependent oxidoreductase n=1 Tax=Pontibacillus salicampi TaxID=1449801 RepID=A0ABV6LKK2_9BACI